MPEESTVRLYHRLEDGLGKDMATVLVEHFATKQDIAELRETLVTKTELKEAVSELKVAMFDMELRLYCSMFLGAVVLIGTNLALFGSTVTILR